MPKQHFRHVPKPDVPPTADLLALAGRLDGSWRQQARCTEVDPEVFFPEQGATLGPARLVCAGCEVRTECLAYALAHSDVVGVWGGVSGRDRVLMLRHARNAEAATVGVA